jgi:hypothetical protein
MIVLVMSEPQGSLADGILQSGISALLCVTQDNVHLRTLADGVVSGQQIARPQTIDIDLPAIKAQLLKAYPLIDRWVSKQQSISTTLELLLEYTVSLIQVIGNHRPHCAVLETGAPHHMFSYSLDVALRYLGITIYYLYGNAFDGRCIVFNGNEKKSFTAVTDYSSVGVIDDFVAQVKSNANYIPADSTKSLAPFWHGQPVYAMYHRLKQAVARCYNRPQSKSGLTQPRAIRLSLPYVGLWDHFLIFKAHHAYLRLLKAQGRFDIDRVGLNDIVYVGHMVPEATSFPECPDYPGEIDVLIDLKNRFPNSRIFYREHPAIAIYSEFGHIHLQGLHKNPAFYWQMHRLGIEVIPPSIHISKIRERGCIFATKTGRVAVENSVLGITSLIYGFPFYGSHLPLTLNIVDLEAGVSVQQIKSQSATCTNPSQIVGNYLKVRFSGSIPNPGIGLGNSPDMRPAFETEIIRLVSKLLK